MLPAAPISQHPVRHVSAKSNCGRALRSTETPDSIRRSATPSRIAVISSSIGSDGSSNHVANTQRTKVGDVDPRQVETPSDGAVGRRAGEQAEQHLEVSRALGDRTEDVDVALGDPAARLVEVAERRNHSEQGL